MIKRQWIDEAKFLQPTLKFELYWRKILFCVWWYHCGIINFEFLNQNQTLQSKSPLCSSICKMFFSFIATQNRNSKSTAGICRRAWLVYYTLPAIITWPFERSRILRFEKFSLITMKFQSLSKTCLHQNHKSSQWHQQITW